MELHCPIANSNKETTATYDIVFKKEKLPVVALVYDFDGTLAPGNMQEFSFIGSVGERVADFWGQTQVMAEEQDSDNVLVYMLYMLQKAKEKGLSIRKESFTEYGKSVHFFQGVMEWFDRIKEYGAENGVIVEHYINSSGMREIIDGTAIASKFKAIFASCYYYDKNGDAIRPAAAINYTNKTQYLYKINKGIFSMSDSVLINESMPEKMKRVPFRNMIYFGDGETDVPCMKMVKQLGGTSVAVFEPGNTKKEGCARNLFNQGRVNFCCEADYRNGSRVDTIIKTLIRKIKADEELIELAQ